MPRNPKLFIEGSMYELCFRLEENLYLAAIPFMREIIISYLAMAQTRYNVKICHFVVMANHLHLLVVVDEPENVPKFVCYFKRESAHAINRFLDRKKRTLWCEGYDSPVILDYDTAITRIVYLYTNPQKANLVDRFEDYPNISSWNAFLSEGETIKTKRIPRTACYALSNDISLKEQQQIARYLKSEAIEDCSLEITPDAWFSCFKEARPKGSSTIRKEVLDKVREAEAELRGNRKSSVMGKIALKEQDFRKSYLPVKFGRRMICLSSIPNYRKEFITWFRFHCSTRNSLENSHPPGLFAPGGFLLSKITPSIVPIIEQ